jgi:aspartate/methionine/tyrosine aminotransferase
MAENELKKYHEIYKKRRDLICKRLDKLKNIFEYQKPDSAYFVFPKIKEEYFEKMAGSGSWGFAIELLEKAKVATVPGEAFGPSGENHIRMCFGRSEEDINIAFDRMEKFFKEF